MTHEQAQRALVSALEDGVATPAKAAEHLRACPECGAFADRLLALERSFERREGLSGRVQKTLEQRILAGVKRAPKTRWKAWWLAIPTLASAVALALFLPVRPAEGGWHTRGEAPPEGNAASVRMRLLCVGQDGVRGDVKTSQGGDAPALHCGLQDVLSFTVSRDADSSARYVFVLGATSMGQTRWYHPRPDEGGSVALPDAPVVDHPLSGVRLGVNHQAGRVRVVALFSEQPLDGEQAKAAAAGMMDKLPAGTVVQTAELVLE